MIGQTIVGRYRIIERIGDGGMGVVYRAEQWPLKRIVALKLLSPEACAEAKPTRRFINEARILSALRHPNTIRLVEIGKTDQEQLFIVTEFVSGGTLREFMRGNRIAPQVALRLARQVSSALAEVHAHGVIHRDLKPDNILLEEVRADGYQAKLIDFGLARRTGDDEGGFERSELTQPRARLGTPGYMAPEQVFRKSVDPSSDLYALGVLMYEMLTGYRLFESDSNRGLYMEHAYTRPAAFETAAPCLVVDPDVEPLVMSLLEKDPKKRPSCAKDVADQLGHILARLDVLDDGLEIAVPAPPREADFGGAATQEYQTVTQPPRNRFRRWLTGALGVMIVIALLV